MTRFGSLGDPHQRFEMLTESIRYNPAKSTIHHAFEFLVCEKVLKSPSTAIDAGKITPEAAM
jgi:hypothetical protein